MIKSFLEKIYDNRSTDSWASRLRKKRFVLFESLIASIQKTPLKILDVGGTPKFWENSGFLNQNFREIEITLLNIKLLDHPDFKCLVGDATNMNQFQDQEFDIVFSNSVIEHVGDYNNQRQMADEIRRVGQRYFVQTPNLYFPIEPHFVFPFFQFLPVNIKVWLITHFSMGWYPKISDQQEARAVATEIQLLSKEKLINLFPEATLYEEKVLGLSKSFIVYEGW